MSSTFKSFGSSVSSNSWDLRSFEIYEAQNCNFLLTFRHNLSWRASSSSSWTAWPLKLEPPGCPDTSLRNYHSTLRKIPKERRYPILRGGSLKSRDSSYLCNTHETLQKTKTIDSDWIMNGFFFCCSASALESLILFSSYWMSSISLTVSANKFCGLFQLRYRPRQKTEMYQKVDHIGM